MTKGGPELDEGVIGGLAPSWKVEVVSEIDSTNRELLRRAEAKSLKERCALFAEHQSAGRGRRERSWDSPPRFNLLFSLSVLLPPGSPKLGLLSQVTALAVAEAVEAIAPGLTPVIKWPNDLLLQDKKFAGILVDARPASFGGTLAIIGIGLNVHHHPPSLGDGALPATSLRDQGADPQLDRNRLAAAILTRLDHLLAAVPAAELRSCLVQKSALIGHRVAVTSIGETLIGLARDLTADGALILALGRSETTIRNAERVRRVD